MKRQIIAVAISLAARSTIALSAPAPQHWIAAWLAPPIAYEPTVRDALGRPFDNETVRQVVRAGASGRAIRVRLTNALSDSPLTIGAASIARLNKAGKVVPGSIRQLTFNGAKDAIIPAHAPYLTDSITMPVATGESFAVSIYFPGQAAPPAHAQMVDIAPGDATRAEGLKDSLHARASGIVSELEVSTGAKPRVLVAFGDSITEGAGASPDKAMSWPAQLGTMLDRTRRGWCWSIVNAGISGNRLLHDGRGPDALSRFDRDALAVAGVTDIVVLEGINDIGEIRDPARMDQAVSAEQIIGAFRQLLARAHAHDVSVILGTLLPYEGAAYASARGEAKRQAVNGWIRSNAPKFDGLIDFDRAMGDPRDARTLRLSEQIGDHLHPNDAGYTRMAKTALPVILAKDCPR